MKYQSGATVGAAQGVELNNTIGKEVDAALGVVLGKAVGETLSTT